jgi:hypothetical protein
MTDIISADIHPGRPCGTCGIDLSGPDVGYDVRYDIRREYAMGGNGLPLRIVPTGERWYCTACAVNAPEPQSTSITVATAEQAAYLTPIYEKYGLGPVREFDEIPPHVADGPPIISLGKPIVIRRIE